MAIGSGYRDKKLILQPNQLTSNHIK